MKLLIKPYKPQAKVIKETWDQEAWALLMEMRTGKTLVTLETARKLFEAGRINGLLVVAPKACYHVWHEELLEHFDADDVNFYCWRGTDTLTEKKEREDALRPEPGWLDVVVVNTEALIVKRARAYLERWLNNHTSLMAVDESTMIKNGMAKRTRCAWALGGLADYRRILTGSMTTQSPLDAFGQMSFLDRRILGNSFVAFRARYAKMRTIRVSGGRQIDIVDGYQRVDELKSIIDESATRVKRRDIKELPPKVYETRFTDLSPEQSRAYDQMAELSIAELEGQLVTATIVLTKLNLLRQIVCGYLMEPGTTNEIEMPCPRYNAVVDYTEELGDKVVIFATYKHVVYRLINALEKRYGSGCAVAWTGDTKHRQEAKKSFVSGPCRFFVATVQTGKFGLDLSEADDVIYFNNDYWLENRIQSEDRVIKMNKSRPVLYTDFVTPSTVEDKVLDALMDKKDIADTINGDNYIEWIRRT